MLSGAWSRLTGFGKVIIVLISMLFITTLSFVIFPSNGLVQQSAEISTRDLFSLSASYPISELRPLPHGKSVQVEGTVLFIFSSESVPVYWLESDGFFVPARLINTSVRANQGERVAVVGTLVTGANSGYVINVAALQRRGAGTIGTTLNTSFFNRSFSNQLLNAQGFVRDIDTGGRFADTFVSANFSVPGNPLVSMLIPRNDSLELVNGAYDISFAFLYADAPIGIVYSIKKI